MDLRVETTTPSASSSTGQAHPVLMRQGKRREEQVPRIEEIKIKLDMEKRDGLRADDLLDDVDQPALAVVRGVDRARHGHMIESIKWGTSNVTLETTGGRVVLRRGATVVVRRQVPTEEETAAKNAEDNAKFLDRMTRKCLDQAVKSFAAVDKAIESIVNDHRYRQDGQHWSIDKYLHATAEQEIWTNVLFDVGKTWHEDNEPTERRVTFADALVRVADELKANLVNNRYRESSSSAVSNVCEAVMREVASQWLTSYYVQGVLAVHGKEVS